MTGQLLTKDNLFLLFKSFMYLLSLSSIHGHYVPSVHAAEELDCHICLVV